MKYLISALFAMSFIMTGCNTMSGVGKDIERGGEQIQDASDDVKEKL